ncbi:hypothetical protein CDL15_Pgr014343 [Punica granatum]|uniref:Uncharacterized protein n=1 Tax=Punica granatum TaxID=22663 RepID=A0A218WEB3_PUNGR|nr:hypothetical protein CDL15_Pgr014343 [Punica granatum]
MSSHIFRVSSPQREIASHPDDQVDVAFSKRGCCFWIPFTSSDQPSSSSRVSPWWRRITGATTNSTTTYDDPWWTRGWKKMREWSEKVAGPKWKTFIRRFGRNRANSRYGGLGGGVGGQFRYDPLSYAMNFDDGQNNHLDDGESLRRDFTTRYASIPSSCKGSMDLGRDGPIFT